MTQLNGNPNSFGSAKEYVLSPFSLYLYMVIFSLSLWLPWPLTLFLCNDYVKSDCSKLMKIGKIQVLRLI